MAESDKVAQLLAAGFEEIGYWHLDGEGAAHLILEAPIESGVYAFIVDQDVCYIGSAQRGLRRRLRKYENARNTGPVAVRLRANVVEALKRQAVVNVLALVCEPMSSWKGLPVDSIAGLEEGLIRAWQPAWNLRGLASVRKQQTKAD